MITNTDCNVTRNSHNGAIEVSAIVSNYRESRIYYGYTRDKAIVEFPALATGRKVIQ